MGRTETPPHDEAPSRAAYRIADVIRRRRDEIVRTWEGAVRAIPRARDLDRPALIDHIPDLLDRIAQATEELGRGRGPAPQKVVAERHAIARLEEGFDLVEVIGELRVLRQAISRAFADPTVGLIQGDELRVLHDAIDAAITGSVEQYTRVRERTLQAALEEAEAAIRVRDDLLAIVSHDLGNPLHAIDLGASLLLQQYGAEPRARKHIDAIRRSTDRMERLLSDLLDMASINAGKLAVRPVQVDARRLVTEVLDLHEPLAHERGITILRDTELDGVTLHVDRDRIAQAFGNLLGNAIKFCAPGDVILVRGERVSDGIRFTFADTGPGIARSDLPHIFEPYWSGRSGKKQGTGLGLFITRAIIEAHRGRIEIGSEPGNGASFAVTLPIANLGTAPATDHKDP